MMSEEFEESDVIFSDQLTNSEDDPILVCPEIRRKRSRSRNREKAKPSINDESSNNRGPKAAAIKKTSPVRIPASVFRCTEWERVEEERDEMTPPHVIIGRRMEGEMAFSVCSGNGRTLKGRDLSRLRNSVLRMTGFLEV